MKYTIFAIFLNERFERDGEKPLQKDGARDVLTTVRDHDYTSIILRLSKHAFNAAKTISRSNELHRNIDAHQSNFCSAHVFCHDIV